MFTGFNIARRLASTGHHDRAMLINWAAWESTCSLIYIRIMWKEGGSWLATLLKD